MSESASSSGIEVKEEATETKRDIEKKKKVMEEKQKCSSKW